MGLKKEYWDQLLGFLESWATVETVREGLLRVELVETDGAPKTVLIEMTRTEWLEIVTIPWGWDFELAAETVRVALMAVADGERLVVGQYDLGPPSD